MRLNLFRRRTSAQPQAEAVARVKAWAAAAGLAGRRRARRQRDRLHDPSCPGVETVLLLMRPGRKTEACKLPKALAEVTEQDIREALSS